MTPIEEESPFVYCKVRQIVSLAPCHIGQPRIGIEQKLNGLLLKYSEHVQGAILSFDHIVLESPLGHIINEMPYIHCKIQVNVLVFKPCIGQILTGTVNKIGSNHIGMLFAGIFNGSVAESELPQGYVHNYHKDAWVGADGSTIGVNDIVKVRVLKIHVAGGMLAIEGSMQPKESPKILKPLTVAPMDITTSEMKQKKKKKRSKDKMMESDKPVELVDTKSEEKLSKEERKMTKKAKKKKKSAHE